MRRLRLAILGASPCGACRANCCRQNGHAYAVLLEGDERRRFAIFAQDVPIETPDGATTFERVLPYVGGRCPFLDDDFRCRIYDDRPANCRRFECAPGYNQSGAAVGEHSLFLRRNPDVLARLERM